MTKETMLLYFDNKYIYNTVISIALFIGVLSFFDSQNINLFVCVLIFFYGFDVTVKLNHLHISLRHRIISIENDKIFKKVAKILFYNGLKVIEFGVYLNAAYSIYVLNGFLFAINMLILFFAVVRIIVTVFFSILKVKHEFYLHTKPCIIPEEYENYLTKNRLVFENYWIGFLEEPKKIIDRDVEIFKIKDPSPVDLGFNKFPKELSVLNYNDKLYSIPKLNDYIQLNNKSFRLLTNDELNLSEIKE